MLGYCDCTSDHRSFFCASAVDNEHGHPDGYCLTVTHIPNKTNLLKCVAIHFLRPIFEELECL